MLMFNTDGGLDHGRLKRDPGPCHACDLAGDTGGNLVGAFEDQVRSRADRLAIHSDGRATSYTELNGRANRVAHTLLGRLAVGDRTVGLLADQGLPLIAGLFGCLKAGRAFVPLDPTYPVERLRAMLADSGATVLLTHERHADLAHVLAGDPSRVLDMDRAPEHAGSANPLLPIPPEQPAYILYTSGSTGRPKGVIHDHASVLHNMLRHREVFGLTADDRQTLLYPCSVYGGIRDTFNALLNGAGLYHYPVKDAGTMGLGDWLIQHRITIYCSVATVFRHFARELQGSDLFPDLRFVKLGGEAPFRTDVDLFREHFGRHCAMLCGLGSTETGITRRYLITPDTVLDGAGVPLGYPIEGVGVMLLDEGGRPVPDGEVGEIAIRSRYIMRGYHGRPDLNRLVLRDDPTEPGVRIFMTGDLGQIVETNCLVHRGRKDQQVKVRGNRVELNEVEAALSHCAGVRDAVVTAGPNAQGDMRLIAYIVPTTQPGPTVRAIRNELLARLPHFMVPNTFVRLASIPQTPNGKIDRRALPEPDAEHLDTGAEHVAPAEGLESKIADAWKKVLNLPEVGATDSFFDLGGDSLMAVQLVLEVERSMNRSLPLSVFYHAATVRDMAAWLSRENQDTPARGVIRLDAIGAKAPLFCLPGRGGTAFSYRGLAALLNDDRPVYALQYPGVESNETPYDRVEDLAAEFVRRIRQVYTDGPVLLLGYSFGGLLAYEMARQLTEAGSEVPYLGLLDTMTPDAIQPRPRWQRLWLHLKDMTPSTAVHQVRDRLTARNGSRNGNGHSGKPWHDTDEPHVPTGNGQISLALQRLKDATRLARSNYRPGPYTGNVNLFKTSNKPGWMRFVKIDETYGWGQRVNGAVRHYTIPGAHLEVFDAAHAPVLAEQVRASLNPPTT